MLLCLILLLPGLCNPSVNQVTAVEYGQKGMQRTGCNDEHVKCCGLSITAKKGGKEEPEGIEISSFALVSGSPSGLVEHGRKLSSCPVHLNFYSISSNGLQEEMELEHGLIT